MAKGQHLSNYQRKIVDRYYANLDTITLNTLGEIVSDLYLAESPKKIEALWKRAEKALAKADPEGKRAPQIVASRDIQALAAFVGELSGKR
ncbi:MAG: hypothetical protein RLN60_04710 [Phycisphaerales bacterium]